MAHSKVPKIKLSSGAEMPAFGLGTWKVKFHRNQNKQLATEPAFYLFNEKHVLSIHFPFQSKPGEVTQAVKDAIDAGYRHIDCAHVYGNEHEVGEGINNKIKEGVCTRDDLFVTSKVSFHNYDPILCNKTLIHNFYSALEYLPSPRFGDPCLQKDPEGPGSGLFGPVPHPLARWLQGLHIQI